MTEIGHIVIGLIVVSAAIYLIIFVSQRLTAHKVAKLVEQKEKLTEIPMRDRLVKGRQLSLTGQSLQQFQILERKYEQLEKTGFAAIDEAANQVLYDSQGLNFVKSGQGLKQLQQQIRDAETVIDIVNQGLKDLEQLDIAHKQAVKDLEVAYQGLRKQLLAESFSYGPAIDKLEEVLGSLEDEFAEFARLTEAGDHAAAAKIYETLGMETPQLEQRMAQIPDLDKTLEETLPDQFKELKEAYQELDKRGFKFTFDVEAYLAELEKERGIALDLLAALTLKKVQAKLDELAEKTDHLYETFDNEALAAQKVFAQGESLQTYLVADRKVNHDLMIDLDRLAQDFIFSKNEVGQVQRWRTELAQVGTSLTELNNKIRQHEVVFSELLAPQEELRAHLARIEEEQTALAKELALLPKIVSQTRQRVVLLKEKMRQIQRMVERQGLAGLPNEYLHQFYVVADELGRLEQQLDSSRVNADDVQRQSSIVTADLDTLEEKTQAVLEAAAITERLVRQASRYQDQAAVREATQQARYYYEHEYDYQKAVATLGATLDQLEPGLTEKTRQLYRQEQATLKAEFESRSQDSAVDSQA